MVCKVIVMQDTFEQIRQQIHEIRNYLGPLDLKLDNLDHQITVSRIAFESKTTELEAKISVNSQKVAEHGIKIDQQADELARQVERIKRIELFLKMPQTAEKPVQAPVREDKLNPDILPPQNPKA